MRSFSWLARGLRAFLGRLLSPCRGRGSVRLSEGRSRLWRRPGAWHASRRTGRRAARSAGLVGRVSFLPMARRRQRSRRGFPTPRRRLLAPRPPIRARARERWRSWGATPPPRRRRRYARWSCVSRRTRTRPGPGRTAGRRARGWGLSRGGRGRRRSVGGPRIRPRARRRCMRGGGRGRGGRTLVG